MSTPAKSYYKIGEVSAMLDVPVSTLRFWEDTFEQLDPFRTPGERASTARRTWRCAG